MKINQLPVVGDRISWVSLSGKTVTGTVLRVQPYGVAALPDKSNYGLIMYISIEAFNRGTAVVSPR